MTKVLYVTSSPRGAASYSNQVAARVLDEIRARDPACEIVSRDLADDPLPHIDETFLIVARTPDGATNDHQKAVLARSDALVDELIGSDIVVIAAPMINLGIPSTLKAWIDLLPPSRSTARRSVRRPRAEPSPRPHARFAKASCKRAKRARSHPDRPRRTALPRRETRAVQPGRRA